jgi:acyl transferase domain-containing protein
VIDLNIQMGVRRPVTITLPGTADIGSLTDDAGHIAVIGPACRLSGARDPDEARIINPQQRMLLECAVEVLENAGCDLSRHPGGASSLFEAASVRRLADQFHEMFTTARADPHRALEGNRDARLEFRASA